MQIQNLQGVNHFWTARWLGEVRAPMAVPAAPPSRAAPTMGPPATVGGALGGAVIGHELAK